MKSILLLLFILIAPQAWSQNLDVKFQWDYTATPRPSGFEIRVSAQSGGLPPVTSYDCGAATGSATLPVNTCVVSLPAAATHYVTVLAYNTASDPVYRAYSDPSNELKLVLPTKPAAPTNMRTAGVATANLSFEVPDDSIAVVNLSFEKK